MKKNIIYPFLFSILTFSACKKDYLNTQPTDKVSTQAIFTTTENAKAAINGIHRSLYIQYNSRQNQGGQGSIMIDADLLGDDLVMTSTGNGWFNNVYRWTAHRSATDTDDKYPYQFYYTIIANANLVIENIDNASGPEADKKVIKAEALCYRAWSHFQLVQFYAKRYQSGAVNSQEGIPLVISSESIPRARATVEEIYTQINKDLDDAIINFTNAPARLNASHFNLSVAKGIKARVALTMQDYAKAAQFASEARSGYSLMSNAQYLQGFNDYTNPEWMWGSHQIEDQTTYFYSFFAYMGNFSSTNNRTNPKAINSVLYNKISSTDIRKSMWDPTGTNTSFPLASGGTRKPYMSGKFLIPGTTSVGDVPMMRVAEMYLIEAEAEARLGQDGPAADALYTLAKNRDPSYVKSTNTSAALIDEIMTQRRVELWGEGFRFFDLKRLDLPLDRTGTNHTIALALTMNVPSGDPMWQFLIPQDEINANPLITQNP